MRNFKSTSIEISGQGDIELLDYALQNMGVGDVVRRFRLLNIERFQYTQLTLTLGGKRRMWQPFRPEFARSASGTHIVSTMGKDTYAQALIKQAGFNVVKVTPGVYPDSGIASGMKMNFSCSLNGRSLSLSIDTTVKESEPPAAQ
jgi:hypothetical protein